MPGLPNYRRILGPKGLVEDREIADEYGRSPATFAITAGSGDFGDISEQTDAVFLVEFTPPIGEVGVSAAVQLLPCFVTYEGDEGAFVVTGANAGETDIPLDDGRFFLLAVGAGDPSLPPSFGETLVVTALAADDGVEKTGTLSFYTRIAEIDDPPVFEPDSLVLTIPLSKTYTAP